MKKVMILITILILFSSFFVIADNDNSMSGNSDDNSNDDNEEVLGASCGTVTPGTQNECCINKGYEKWDSEKQECENELELEVETDDSGTEIKYKEKSEIEYSNGTKIKYEYELRERHELTSEQKQKIIQTKNQLKINAQNQECPENCTCSGSTLKCVLNGSREMTIHAGNSGNIIVQSKSANASTDVALYKSEDGKVYAQFKNNETKEIILPDEVHERIQNRTKAKLQNETINLTEEGNYEIRAQKQARLLWMIKVREETKLNVDAETGEIIRTRNSWWGFLAKDIETEDISEVQ